MKLNPDQRAAMHQWAVGGEMPDLTAAKALAAKFSQPFTPTSAQFAYYMAAAKVERRKDAEKKRKKGIKQGLAIKDARIAKLEELFARHEQLIEARAIEVSEIESGKTGLLARDYRGKDADIPIYKYDAALIKEMRGILDDLAREEGARTSKVDATNININWDDLTDDELKRIAAGETPASVLAARGK